MDIKTKYITIINLATNLRMVPLKVNKLIKQTPTTQAKGIQRSKTGNYGRVVSGDKINRVLTTKSMSEAKGSSNKNSVFNKNQA